jgi:6-phosphogluconolactonase
VQTLSTYPADDHADTEKSAAELLLSADGHRAYVTLRGDRDEIVVYDIARKQGTLTEIQRVKAAGRSPIAIKLDPKGRWLLCANEISGSVTEFAVDQHNGRLTLTGNSLAVPRAGALVVYSH